MSNRFTVPFLDRSYERDATRRRVVNRELYPGRATPDSWPSLPSTDSGGSMLEAAGG